MKLSSREAVHAVQIAGGVGHGEDGLEIQVQRGVAERSKVDQRRLSMGRLQSQREIDGHGGGAAAALGIDDGKNFAARTFLSAPGAGRWSGGRRLPADRWWWWGVR